MELRTRWNFEPRRWVASANNLIICSFMALVFANVCQAQKMPAPFPKANATQVNFFDADDGRAVTPGVNDVQQSYLESRVANLEAQIQSLQLDSANRVENSGGIENGKAGFYFGAAAVWVKPHFKEAFQYSQTNVLTGQQTLFPFQYEYDASPRIWVGVRNANGVGLRGTYWSYDGNGNSSTNMSDGFNIYGAHAITIIFPANILAAIPGSTLQNQDSLETQITNLYATYDVALNGITASGGVGLRYASLLQTLSSVVTGPLPASLDWTREYHGLGPSVALDATKRIGCSRFSGVASGSGAFLFGTKTISRTVFGDASPQPASPFLTLEEADEVVGIGDVGFGLEWSAIMNRGSALTFRGTYEGQFWAEAGAPTLGFLGFQGFALSAELRR